MQGGTVAAKMHFFSIIYCMKCHFFTIIMMIMHLEFYENWSGKSGNFVVAN